MSVLSLDDMSFSGVAWTFKFQHVNTETSMWPTVLKASIWSLRTLRYNIYKIVHSTYSCCCHDLNINDAFQILLYLLLNS